MGAIHRGLLTVVLVVISLALVIGIPLVIGWILTLFLPFSLFEGTLLGMIASLVTGMIWYNILRFDPSSEVEEEENDSEGEILESRFWRTNAERTWENWFRYMIANSVYEDLLDSPRWVEETSEEQLQELSIHLADAALSILKTKSPRATQLRVSKGRLKHEMVKIGQPPYEDSILNAGVAAVNVVLAPMEAVLKRIVREQLWDEPAGIN
ncbi:MAG: hypothetical protein O7G87_09030 [bacterium]|nr:hypothetical protein [bacterium]